MASELPRISTTRPRALRTNAAAKQRRADGDRPARIAPRLLRRTDAAQYLGLSVATFDALRLHGEIAAVPVPATHREGELLRVPLFDVRDLDTLVDRWKAAR